MKNQMNVPVTITSMGFGRDMRVVPRRMEFEGRSVEFVDSGLRAVIKKGEQIAQIFTMTDGNREFRIKSDNHGGSWTLLSVA